MGTLHRTGQEDSLQGHRRMASLRRRADVGTIQPGRDGPTRPIPGSESGSHRAFSQEANHRHHREAASIEARLRSDTQRSRGHRARQAKELLPDVRATRRLHLHPSRPRQRNTLRPTLNGLATRRRTTRRSPAAWSIDERRHQRQRLAPTQSRLIPQQAAREDPEVLPALCQKPAVTHEPPPVKVIRKGQACPQFAIGPSVSGRDQERPAEPPQARHRECPYQP